MYSVPSSLVSAAPLDQANGMKVCHEPLPPAGRLMPYSTPALSCRSLANCFRSSQLCGASSQPAFSARSVR